MAYVTGMDASTMQREECIKVNGKMVAWTDMVYFITLIIRKHMKVSGKMTSSTEKEQFIMRSQDKQELLTSQILISWVINGLNTKVNL